MRRREILCLKTLSRDFQRILARGGFLFRQN
jgi:hypothetical protein